MKIFEVLEEGPILAGDEESGRIITMHGDAMDLWTRQSGTWEVVQTKGMPPHQGLCGITVADAMDAADDWLDELNKA